MGCKGSKLDDQQAVVLCRGRSELLAAAVRHRFALADSHAAVTASFLSFSDSLVLLFNLPEAPTLTLPPHRKPDPSPPPNHQIDNHHRSRSHSGSHIHFHPSDSEHESDKDSGHSSVYSPLHEQNEPAMPYPYPYSIPNMNDSYGNNFLPNYNYQNNNDPNQYYNVYYAKSKPPKPSITIRERPPSSETGYSSYGYNNLYSNPYYYGETGNGYLPSNARPETRPAASSRPPPSPPKVNTWDYFNPFEVGHNYETTYQSNYNPHYTPSRSSREVRDEEGIPDLEDDEEIYPEVVKEVYEDDNSIASSSTQEIHRTSTGTERSNFQSARYEARRSEVEKEVQEMVDKKVVNNEIKRKKNEIKRPNVVNNNKRRERGEISDLISEIKSQFERASEASKELGSLLEVGKRRYETRNSVYQVSSRMVSAMAPVSVSSDADLIDFEENKGLNGSNNNSLRLTLQKLYIWEKKLYDEVKAEEKMRLLLAKTMKRLKQLDQRGAEPHKIDASRKLARKLSTKIRIAIQVVNSISEKINKVRDEELCPQLNFLIHGFMRMWREILDCHEIQLEMITQFKAQNLDSIISNKNSMQLEFELMKFSVNFSSWVNMQKSFVKALNGWLSLCINPEPELTVDGPAPYSPGRIGAPPIFVLCNIWSQEMDKIEESGVVEWMRSLARILKREMESRVFVDQNEQVGLGKEREKWVREMERRSYEISKEVEVLNKKLILVPGEHGLNLSGLTSGTRLGNESESFGVGFENLIDELRKFAEICSRVYEELHLNAEKVCRERT